VSPLEIASNQPFSRITCSSIAHQVLGQWGSALKKSFTRSSGFAKNENALHNDTGYQNSKSKAKALFLVREETHGYFSSSSLITLKIVFREMHTLE
jgi:hypothetical protein